MSSRLFTDWDALLAKICLLDPDHHHLTAPECRACRAVIRHVESGAAMQDDEVRIARSLIAALMRETEPDNAEAVPH